MIRCNPPTASISNATPVVKNFVNPSIETKVLGEQIVDIDKPNNAETTTFHNVDVKETVTPVIFTDGVTLSKEPELVKPIASASNDFFQELDEECKLVDSLQQYYLTLKIERDPFIGKDRPFNKHQIVRLNNNSTNAFLVAELSSSSTVSLNSMGNLVDQKIFSIKKFKAPFVLGLWTACFLLIFGSDCRNYSTFVTLVLYFGELSTASTEFISTMSAIGSTLYLMLTDMFAFLSNYKKHFLSKRNAKPAVNKLSGQ
jgi:hypothetical protein